MEGVFRLMGPNDTYLLVNPVPGPSGANPFLNLSIAAINWGVKNYPPAYGYFNLMIDVRETRVLDPNSRTICYVDFSCPVRFWPAEGYK